MNEEQKPAIVSFSRAKQTLAAAPPQPQSTAVVPAAAPGALTTPGNPAQGLVGEFDSSDLKKPPVLKYVTGNAELAAENPEWANKFVWDGAICFGPEVVVIPTRLTKNYREKRPYPDNNPTPPASFKTKAEAEASGLPIVDVGLVEFLIELTKEQAALAPAQSWVVDLGGKPYLPAVSWFQNTAYEVVRTLVSDYGRHLKGRFANGQYKLQTKVFQGKTGPYRAPVLKAHGATPKEVSDAIAAEFKI